MKKRCYNDRCRSWPDYGGRGITVCDEWRTSFETFYRDMGPRPVGASINRIDNDGPYAPTNCEWATRKTQNNNTRRNHYLEFNGERHTIAEWTRRCGFTNPLIITKRLKRGWSSERAITTAV